MHRGYIKIWRKFTDWEWFGDSMTTWFFINLLLMANVKDKKWEGIIIKRGQFVSSIENLRFKHGLGGRKKRLSVKSTRTLLSRLKASQNLASESTNQYTLFSILNYNLYQDKPTSEGASKGQAKGKQRANEGQQLKNVKNDKNVKRGTFIPPTLQEVQAYCLERKNGINAQKFIDYHEARGWMLKKTKMVSWKATIRTWEGNQKAQENEIARVHLP